MPHSDLVTRFLLAWSPERWCDERVLVAVSGGADSVALLRLLAAAKKEAGGSGKLIVGHFNHRLRGEESGEDARFVERLATELALHCEVGRASSASDASTTSEDAARDARYAFLQEVCERIGARLLVTAHTADDQAETVLLNLIRGTGLAGLGGMPRVRSLGGAVSLVRPLLEFRRAELREYLSALNQPFRHDRSNDDPRYRRNRVRGELVPLIEEIQGAGAIDAIVRSARLAFEAQGTIYSYVCETFPQFLLSLAGDEIVLDAVKLRGKLPYYVREIFRYAWQCLEAPLQDMTAEHWNALAEMSQATEASETVQRDFPGTIRATREADKMTLRRIS